MDIQNLVMTPSCLLLKVTKFASPMKQVAGILRREGGSARRKSVRIAMSASDVRVLSPLSSRMREELWYKARDFASFELDASVQCLPGMQHLDAPVPPEAIFDMNDQRNAVKRSAASTIPAPDGKRVRSDACPMPVSHEDRARPSTFALIRSPLVETAVMTELPAPAHETLAAPAPTRASLLARPCFNAIASGSSSISELRAADAVPALIYAAPAPASYMAPTMKNAPPPVMPPSLAQDTEAQVVSKSHEAGVSRAAMRTSRLESEIEGLTMAQLKEKIQEVTHARIPCASTTQSRTPCLNPSARSQVTRRRRARHREALQPLGAANI
jgi:hypothetical protein